MIKKIIIIVAVAVFLIVPVVFANDAGPGTDRDRITVKITPKSNQMRIGEFFEFNLEIKNNTAGTITILDFEQLIEGSGFYFIKKLDEKELVLYVDEYETAIENDDFHKYTENIDIEPYQTTIICIKYKVPEDIYWYKNGDNYYANIMPVLHFWSTEIFFEDEGGWDFIHKVDKGVAVQISNITDGKDIVSIDIIDDNNRVAYADTNNTSVSLSFVGQYYSEFTEYITIENKSTRKLEIINIKGSHENFKEDDKYYTLDGLQSINTYTVRYAESLPEDIKSKETIYQNVLFKVAGESSYYGVYAEKEVSTVVLSMPDVIFSMEVDGDSDEEKRIINLIVKNNTKHIIKDFCVIYYYSDLYELEKLENDFTYGDLGKGETWTIPIFIGEDDSKYKITFGYMVDNSLYYWQHEIHLNDSLYIPETSFAELFRNGYNDGHYKDMFLVNNSVVISDIKVIKYTPTPKYTISANTETISSTPSPRSTATTTAEIIILDTYYIPLWAWLAVLAAALASSALIYYIKKTKENG